MWRVSGYLNIRVSGIRYPGLSDIRRITVNYRIFKLKDNTKIALK